MEFLETKLKKNFIIKINKVEDKRGFLKREFCQKNFDTILEGKTIRQINSTYTKNKGTVRGLHFQKTPFTEIKIISCTKGKVWDVAVDLRKNSPTFLKYHSVILSKDINESFLIPEGFAHGYQTLSPDCEMLYLHTSDYNKDYEDGINILDPKISIPWPDKISIQSERDKNFPNLTSNFVGLNL
jgi:dTDP-4-dehydrorhamnose 3,5-epimerase